MDRLKWTADTGILNRIAMAAMGSYARYGAVTGDQHYAKRWKVLTMFFHLILVIRWLGTLWIDMGKIGGRWNEAKASQNKRNAVMTVEAFGMAGPAMDLARHVS